jgi:hypothetical protein
MGIVETRTGVILDVAGPRSGGRSVRTLIGSFGDLGFLVKHLSSGTGQGGWRLFANERNLANHLRAMALAEAEVQRVLNVLGSEGRVELADPRVPPAIPTETAGFEPPAERISPKTGPR